MSAINKKIEITAELKTVLGDVNKTINDLQTKLKQQNFDFSKNQNFAKMLTNYKDAYASFSNYVKNDSIDFLDAKDVIKSGEQVIKIFRQIQGQYGNLLDISEETAKKLFPEQFKANITKAEQAIARFTKASNDLIAKSSEYNEATNELARLRTEADRIANTKIRSDFNEELELTRKKADEATKALEELYTKVGQRLYKKKTKGTSLENKTIGSIEKEINQAKSARSQEKENFRNQKSNFKSLKAIDDHYEATIANLRLQLKEAKEITKEIDAELDKVKGGDTKALTKTEKNSYDQQAEEIAHVEKETRDLIKAQQEAYATEKQRADAIEKSKRALSDQEKKTQTLSESVEKLRQASSIPDLFKQLQELNIPTDGIEQTAEGIQKISANLSNINSQAYQQLIQSLRDTGKTADEAEAFVEQLRTELTGLGNSAKDIQRANTEMENLKNQIKTFFSITNSIQLLKRTVSSAIATVKELDATMTEAAVVTDFSVGDMWNKLPEYSAQAQKLGVSINGMYQATTLYYQQGLKSNEAMALGVETMKMAKIAGMETADATKAMTAALRGFNMELSETSAIRVNDVYSELAAVTAADAGQIATAMGKTASIAASANMEFETTAALLAQIIETTQEAPETAGTAMKTIIARFSEVKSLRDLGETTGKDSEGEDIDVNKIQAALKTVGISMDGFFAGTEGLDSILLKLAEKWKTLDTETQRYIATMAAGSRQQSRFIAMMSDYERTTELVAAANESAGSSQKQFEKTMDSMESKLTRLKNAWDEFTMGLANNEILKFAVDTLTFIIEGVNKLTDALSGGNGLAKSIVSLITVISALKGGGAIFNKAFGGFSENLSLGKQGKIQETITEQIQDDGSIVRTIVKNPTKEGEQAGEEFGTGLMAGLKRVISTDAKGNRLGAMFTTGLAEEVNGKNIESPLQKYFKKKSIKTKTSYDADKLKSKIGSELASFQTNQWITNDDGTGDNYKDKINKLAELDMQLKNGSISAEDAAKKFQELDGDISDVVITTEKGGKQLKNASLDMNALGQATMVVGGALGLLASAFEEAGMEEYAEPISTLSAVFTGLGSVMMVLSSVAPMMGMSFTNAGIQITKAGVTSQLAWWWVFLIIGAVALLTAGIIAMAKAAKEASDEFKLEKLNEQIEDLGNLADEAKERLESISEAREGLEKMRDTFDNLVYGSQEWKKALVENNQQVLELLNTYPELAKYMGRGTHGELIIADAGWDSLIQQQQQEYTTAINAKTAMTQSAAELQLKMDFEDTLGIDFQKTANAINASVQDVSTAMDPAAVTGYQIGSMISGQQPNQMVTAEDIMKQYTGGLSEDEYYDFVAAIASQGVNLTDKGSLQKVYEQIFGTIDGFDSIYGALQNLGDNFEQVANSALEVKTAEQARIKTVAKANALMSKQVSESDSEEAVIDAAEQAFDDYNEQVDKEKAKYTYKADKGTDHKDNQTIINAYAKKTGKTVEEVKNEIKKGNLTYEAMQGYLASSTVDERMIKVMEEMTKKLDAISDPKKKRTAQGLLTDGGLGLTKKQADSIDDMKQYIQDTFRIGPEDANRDAAAKALGYASYDDMVTTLTGNLEAANRAFENAYSKAASYGVKDVVYQAVEGFEALDNVELTAGQMQSLANALSQVAVNGGDVTELMRMFPSLLKGLSGDELANAINIISSTDWTKQDGIDSTISALKNLGVEIDDSLTRSIYNVAHAIMSLNLDKMESDLAKLQELIDNVVGKIEAGDKTFTKDEMDALVDQELVDESAFIRTGINEYVFMGDTNDLLDQINDKVGHILTEMSGDLGKAVETGYKYERIMNGSFGVAAYDEAGHGLMGATLSAKDILKNIGEGKHPGQYVNIYALQNLARLLGIEGYENMTYEGLVEAIKSGYDNYYLKLEKNAEKQRLINTQGMSINYANEATGSEFSSKLESAAKKQQLIKDSGFITQELLKDIITSDSKYSDTNLKVMAEKLGLEGFENLGREQILTWLSTFYGEAYLAEDTLEALISQTNGLGIAVDVATDSLRAEGSAIADNSDLIKYFVIKSYAASQSIDSLNQVLEESAEAFAINNLETQEYRAALDKIAYASKNIFGDQVDYNFVHQYRDLFEQLTKGGEQAQKAFQQLGIQSVRSFLDGIGKEQAGNQIVEILQNVFDNEKIGRAFDAEQLVKEISEALGISIKQVIPIIKAAGIDITGESGQFIGTILDASGTGLFDFEAEDFEWENPYDKYYETVQDINDELRERERLEKEYQRLARRTNSSVSVLNKNREQRLARLDSERELREELLVNRKDQMSDLEKEYSKFSKYARYDEDTGTIDMNWNLINKLEKTGSEETVKALEEYISKLEEYQGYIQEEEDALDEIKDIVYDIYQEGKEEYFNLEDQVKNALIEARQEEIDKLSAINDSINNSNSQIVAAMQESIAQRRQERDNEKTEQELTDKRRRLMYLQMDTSNANDLEVLKLQKEIAEGEEDYTDQLIDQKISEIQDQNEKAAEQRQAQIEILQAQLEYYQKYDIWEDVEKLIAEGLGENGVIEGTELWHILTQSDEYLTASKLRKENWVQDLQSMARAALSWLEMGRSSRAAFSTGDIVKGQEISFYDKNNNLLTGKVDENGYVVVDDKKYEVFEDEDGKWYAKKYAKGGLADFTGPAWLDGTKSKPEYVLNASQTQAFLSLVDVLEHFDRGFGNTSTENFGDNIIDIDINIETVKEEADVDMLAEKIQQSIVSSARYRNNNFVQR